MAIMILMFVVSIGLAVLGFFWLGSRDGSFSSAFLGGVMGFLIGAVAVSCFYEAFEKINAEAIKAATVETVTEETIVSAEAMYSKEADSASKLMLVWTDSEGAIHEDELKNHRNGYVNSQDWKSVTTSYEVTGIWYWLVSCPEWEEKTFYIPTSEVIAGAKQAQ